MGRPRPELGSTGLPLVEAGFAQEFRAALVVGLAHGSGKVGRASEVEAELGP
jgi:hypothetical protein